MVPKVQRLGAGTVTRVARSAVVANISAQPQRKVAGQLNKFNFKLFPWHTDAQLEPLAALAHRNYLYYIASLAMLSYRSDCGYGCCRPLP